MKGKRKVESHYETIEERVQKLGEITLKYGERGWEPGYYAGPFYQDPGIVLSLD